MKLLHLTVILLRLYSLKQEKVPNSSYVTPNTTQQLWRKLLKKRQIISFIATQFMSTYIPFATSSDKYFIHKESWQKSLPDSPLRSVFLSLSLSLSLSQSPVHNLCVTHGLAPASRSKWHVGQEDTHVGAAVSCVWALELANFARPFPSPRHPLRWVFKDYLNRLIIWPMPAWKPVSTPTSALETSFHAGVGRNADSNNL